jgi:hypothetical protein
MTSRGWLRKHVADNRRAATANLEYALEAFRYQNQLAWDRADKNHKDLEQPILFRYVVPNGEEYVMQRNPKANELFLKWVRKANKTQEAINRTLQQISVLLARFALFLFRLNRQIDTIELSASILTKLGHSLVPAFEVCKQSSPLEIHPQIQTTCAPNA